MKGFWEKTKKTLKSKASSLGEKVEEYGKYGKLTLTKYNLIKQLEKMHASLGSLVYSTWKEEKLKKLDDNEEILNLLLKIRGLENEIKEVEDQIATLKREEEKQKKKSE